ncbi:MAG TPA: hypothetical protein VJ124_12565 [Pyrinomonadaceae bacterium]|nr:hypothetical protein [Pyrinomonadaceae bacterium]
MSSARFAPALAALDHRDARVSAGSLDGAGTVVILVPFGAGQRPRISRLAGLPHGPASAMTLLLMPLDRLRRSQFCFMRWLLRPLAPAQPRPMPTPFSFPAGWRRGAITCD